MDRYVIREQRNAGDYPEGNQMITLPATSAGNNIIIKSNDCNSQAFNVIYFCPENVYYGGYAGNIQKSNVQHLGAPRLVAPQAFQAQGQIVPGMNPSYLSAHFNSDTTYTPTSHREQPLSAFNTFGSDYQNRNFMGPEVNKGNFKRAEAAYRNFNVPDANHPNDSNFIRAVPNKRSFKEPEVNNRNFNSAEVTHYYTKNEGSHKLYAAQRTPDIPKPDPMQACKMPTPKKSFEIQQKGLPNAPASKKQTENDSSKPEEQKQMKTRADKLKELYAIGTKVFSGSVEKILQWHKSIKDIGATVLYEVVGKCVNIRAGEGTAKILVVRDDNGPAIQVVYYEIDFLLPEIKIPSIIRIVGRMMPGTNRLQAFSVRVATGDDIATLPRRAAVTAHHVTKLCKEYGVEVLYFK